MLNEISEMLLVTADKIPKLDIFSFHSFSDICQIRFDFDTFSTTNTATTGVCADTFTISDNSKGGNTTPNLCGTLSGQHCKLFYIIYLMLWIR